MQAKRDRLVIGLKKLNDTNDVITSLQEEQKLLQPELITKSKETEELLKQVAIDKENADKVAENPKSSLNATVPIVRRCLSSSSSTTTANEIVVVVENRHHERLINARMNS